MFETSRDILNWVLALSAASLAFFLCWSLYYLIASAQRIFRLIKQVERGVSKAEDLIDLVRNKVSGSAAYLSVLGELLKRGVEFAQAKRQRQSTSGSENKKTKNKK